MKTKTCCAIGCHNQVPITKAHKELYGGFCQKCHARIVKKAEKRTKEPKKPDLYDKYGWRREEKPLALPYKMKHGFYSYKKDLFL